MGGKRVRQRLAKSEVWMHLAVTAQRWSDDVGDRGTGRPFVDWEKDGVVDPFHELCRTYSLAPTDLSRLIGQVAQELENRALRAGYDDHWEAGDENHYAEAGS